MKYDIAHQLVARALEHAQSSGFSAAASVVDSGGHLICFGRSDGASFLAVEVTRRKAFTAVALGVPTAALAAFAAADASVGADLQKQIEICTVAGGVPVRINGALVGGLGVAGGQASQDQSVAEFALQQVIGTPPSRV